MSKLVERGFGIKGKKNRETNEHMKIEHHVFFTFTAIFNRK